MTQFGRALHALNIEHPLRQQPAGQGAGRAGAQAPCRTGWSRSCGWPGSATSRPRQRPSCPAFMADYNARFAKAPRNQTGSAPAVAPPATIWRMPLPGRRSAPSIASADPAVRQGDLPSRAERAAKAAIGKRVTVLDYPDGRLSIRYKGVELAYRTFDKLRRRRSGRHRRQQAARRRSRPCAGAAGHAVPQAQHHATAHAQRRVMVRDRTGALSLRMWAPRPARLLALTSLPCAPTTSLLGFDKAARGRRIRPAGRTAATRCRAPRRR